MFDKHTHTLIAQRLDQAEKQREQIRAISLDYPEITIEDAYAVQREWVRLKIAEGRTLKGHKIGLTSKAMQASSQISEPDYGALLDDMFFHDGSDIPTDRFIVPRIEVELAFVLAKPLRGPNCTLFDVYNATDYVIPALERVFSVWGRNSTILGRLTDQSCWWCYRKRKRWDRWRCRCWEAMLIWVSCCLPVAMPVTINKGKERSYFMKLR